MKKQFLAMILFLPVWSFGQTYSFSTLVKFSKTAPSPENPNALISDAAGNLYGTSVYGGAYGTGSVFKVTPKGVLSVLYSFRNSTDGGWPYGPLVRDTAGNLYGETFLGGINSFGTIFKLTPSGTETVLYEFSQELSVSGGSSLVLDSAGNLYGYNTGGDESVFELTKSGEYKTLYTFCSGSSCGDGAGPVYHPTLGPNGVLYGVTGSGGDYSCNAAEGCGVVFELDPNGTETVLHRFTGGTDGEFPSSDLVRDSDGNLYGTTSFGGAGKWGVLFKVNSSGDESIVYSFCSLASCADGASPGGNLLLSSGNVYGITQGNGVSPETYGNIFEVTPEGAETVLYTATGAAKLGSRLVSDKSGNLYGTTWDGGPNHTGTVYKLTKN